VVVGGIPCQGFSTLGKRLVEDPRNILFCEFTRLVKEINPPIFVLENVSGMKTMKDLKNNVVYDMVKNAFRRIGYEVNSYLLNAVNFGVPQERKRLFFIGCKYSNISFVEPKVTHFVDYVGTFAKQDNQFKGALTMMDVISDLPEIGPGEQSEKYLPPQTDYQRIMRKVGTQSEVKKLTLHYSHNYSKKISLIMKTIPSGSGKTIWQLLKENPEKVPEGAIPTSGFKNTYGRLSPDNPSMTITRNFACVSSSRCIHPFQNRSLTPREAARIQSFKDDYVFLNCDIEEDRYTKKLSKKQDISDFASFVPDVPERGEIYIFEKDLERRDFSGQATRAKNGKRGTNLLIGNAVPPLLAEAVSGAVAKMLDEISRKKKSGSLEPIDFKHNNIGGTLDETQIQF